MYDIIKKLSKHTIIFAISRILNRAISFFLIPLYLKYLTPSDYGILELLSVTLSVINIFVILGMADAFFKAFSYDYEDEEGRREVVSTAFYFMLAVSFICFGILIILSKQISSILLKTASLAYLFRIIFINGFWGVNYIIPRDILRAKLESVKYSVIHVIEFLISIGLNIYFVVFLKMGLVGILYSGLISNTIGFCISIPFAFKFLRLKFSIPKLKSMLAFGLPLVPSLLGLWVLTLSDRYFLNYFSTPHELGLYSLGYKFAMIFQVVIVTPFLLTWPSIFFPLAKKENAPVTFAKLFTYFLLLCLFLTLALSFFVSPLINLAPPEFRGAHTVVPVMILTMVLAGAFRHLDIGLEIQAKTKYVSYIMCSAALLNLGLNYLLVPEYGMMGAACGTLLTHFAMCGLTFLINRKFYPIPYESVRIAKIMLVFLLIFLFRMSLSISSTVLRTIIDVILVTSFPGWLYLLRFYTDTEIGFVKNILKRKGSMLTVGV